MSMDFYTRQVGKPHMVTVSHELNCHVISGSPPISTGNSESNLLSTTTQQPAQQVQLCEGLVVAHGRVELREVFFEER